MRLHVICFCLTLWTTGVLSNVMAGPYQTMFLWYAYRMDLQANGIGTTTIAKGCKGSGPGGSCLFDEFLRHIENDNYGKTKNNPWPGKTSVGNNLTPDISSGLADDITKSGYKYTPDLSKLLPGNTIKVGTFSAQYEAVLDVIQGCRKKMTDVKLGVLLSNSQIAFKSVHDMRVADQAKSLIKTLNEEISVRQQKWTVSTTQSRAPNGLDYEKFDSQATLEAHPEAKANLVKWIKNTDASWDTDKAAGQAKNHYRAIQACQVLETRLREPPAC